MATGCTRDFVTYTICATVPTGLEHVALEECTEVFGRNIRSRRGRGKIFFELSSIESVQKVRQRQVAKLFQQFVKLSSCSCSRYIQ